MHVLPQHMRASPASINHAAWVGPVISALGFITYFGVAVRFPDLRDSAVVNLALIVGGAAIAGWGLLRRRNWRSWIGFAAASGLALLFCTYIFFFTRHLPSPDTAPVVGGMAPPIELPDQSGRVVSLDGLRRMSMLDNPDGGRVLLVFYRGFW